jgi:hypothetical protein
VAVQDIIHLFIVLHISLLDTKNYPIVIIIEALVEIFWTSSCLENITRPLYLLVIVTLLS